MNIADIEKLLVHCPLKWSLLYSEIEPGQGHIWKFEASRGFHVTYVFTGELDSIFRYIKVVEGQLCGTKYPGKVNASA